MGKINAGIKLFNKEELRLIHKASMDILAEPGMKFVEAEFLNALEKKGCKYRLQAYDGKVSILTHRRYYTVDEGGSG